MDDHKKIAAVQIGDRTVGPGNRALVIAEVGQSHDGSLGFAHAFIDAAAEAGADAVKFQTHIAEAESTLDEPFRVRFSKQDKTRYDYWRRIEFTPSEWESLARHAEERRLLFLSSAFSLAAIEILQTIGVPAWKLGSGEFGSLEIIDAMAATRLPILFSTGMATENEISDAVRLIEAKGTPFALLQCTSLYPTPFESVGLNVIPELRKKFRCPVGLSDHSGTPYPGLAAIARGADLLEVHVTFHRSMFGPDVSSSVDFDELKLLCTMRDAVAVMDAHPIDKDVSARELNSMRQIFGKSLAPARTIPAGAVLTEDLVTAKKPGGGIPLTELSRVLGRRLKRAVSPDRLLRWDDIEGQ